jgi:8-oxo-dGTP pyrophosphatase MutT (NUDIX family)
MSKPPAIKRQVSSGGIVFRTSDRGIEVALVAVKRGTVWCLPKGLINKDEGPESAALREVREETGLTGEMVDKIGQISYWYFMKDKRARIHKTVHFYLLRYTGGSTEEHDYEVDEAKWFLIDEAISRLTYNNEKEMMQKAKEMIERLH